MKPIGEVIPEKDISTHDSTESHQSHEHESEEENEKDILLLASISQKHPTIPCKSNEDLLSEKLSILESQMSQKDQELNKLSSEYECKLKELKNQFEIEKNVLLDTNRVMTITLTNTQNALKDSKDDVWIDKTVKSRVDAEMTSCKVVYKSLESEYISKIKQLQEQVLSLQSTSQDKSTKISSLESILNKLHESKKEEASFYKIELENTVSEMTLKLESEIKKNKELEASIGFFTSKENLYQSEKDILQSTINNLLEQVKSLEKQILKQSKDSEDKNQDTIKIQELNEALELAKIENFQEMKIWQSKVSELKAQIQKITTQFQGQKYALEGQLQSAANENAELKNQKSQLEKSAKEDTEHFQYQLKSLNDTLALLSKRIVETESQLTLSSFKNNQIVSNDECIYYRLRILK